MTCYIIKKGVYLHGVFGPYPDFAAAFVAFHAAYLKAQKSKNRDERNAFDGYHQYGIHQGALPDFDGKSPDFDGAANIAYQPLENTGFTGN